MSHLDTRGCTIPGKHQVIIPIDAIDIRELSEFAYAQVANLQEFYSSVLEEP
jgi:hypothetical protein